MARENYVINSFVIYFLHMLLLWKQLRKLNELDLQYVWEKLQMRTKFIPGIALRFKALSV